jgi:transcriptional regulator with XRE-family HTH domain
MTHRQREAQFIRARREELGLTQMCLAKILGKQSKSYIARIEAGEEGGIPIWMLLPFAKALKVDVKKLIVLRLRAYEEEIRAVVFGSKRSRHK